MKTILERVERRVTKTATGCWLWNGAMNNKTTPVIRVGGKVESVRRKLTGRADPVLIAACGDHRCVAPEHTDNKLDVGVRIARLAGTTERDLCWYTDRHQQPIIDGTTARQLAYRHFIGETQRRQLTTLCKLPGCFNPWHVTPEPETTLTKPELEELEIEDCVCFILGSPNVDPYRFYDEPTILAARRRIEEEGL